MAATFRRRYDAELRNVMNVPANDKCRMSNGHENAATDPFVIRHSSLIKRLIVNADDFGLSRSVNEAVIRAHREGILTSASLMVNESGFDEAVRLAKENPRLGVGLHLTLLMGHSALSTPAASSATRQSAPA